MQRWLVLVFAIGCGSGGSNRDERPLCTAMARLCGMEPARAAECREVDDELRREAGATYDSIARCGTSATTCGELFGCIVSVSIDGAHPLRDLAPAPTTPPPAPTTPPPAPTTPPPAPTTPPPAPGTSPPVPTASPSVTQLPAECARLDQVCSARDRESVGEDCIRMVENLRLDPGNRNKLAACIAGAMNCFAADNCIDDLWLELN